MCCPSPSWTPKANSAKSIGIAVLTFAIIDLLTFAVQGYAAGIASLIAIVASSIIICCGPPTPGPGRGSTFTAVGVLSLIASVVHFVGIVLLIVFYINLHNISADTVTDNCIDSACSGTAWQTASCDNSYNTCTSEAECMSATCTYCSATVCRTAGTIVQNWIYILVWPGILLSVLCFSLELALAVTSFQAAPGMSSPAISTPLTDIKTAPAGYAGQPTYGQPVAVAYASP